MSENVMAWAPLAGNPVLLSVSLPSNALNTPLESSRFLALLELRLARLIASDPDAKEQIRLQVDSEGWGDVARRVKNPVQAAGELLWIVEAVHEKVRQEMHRVTWPVQPPFVRNPEAVEVLEEDTVETFLLAALPLPERG